jgi:anti-anti-sigma factor
MTAADTVRLSGEFDMAATFTVEPALERMLETHDLDLLTLDLSAVTFIDSVGLGVVIRFSREAEARGAALCIVPGPPDVQRVFETAGLEDALPFDRSSAAWPSAEAGSGVGDGR